MSNSEPPSDNSLANEAHRQQLIKLLDRKLSPGDIVNVLHRPGAQYYDDARIAFSVLLNSNEDACKEILYDLLEHCTNQRFAVDARDTVMALPREWVISHIETIAEPILRLNDHTDYVLLLALYEMLSPDLAARLTK